MPVMVDIVSASKRSQMMAGIRGKNTQPELVIRKELHSLGFRYRLHDSRLPGKPDLAFPKYNAVILVHGCFWHGHECHLFKWPSSRKEFWRKKITRNQEKDLETLSSLRKDGWRILTLWECALKGRTRKPLEKITEDVAVWLESSRALKEIKGKKEK